MMGAIRHWLDGAFKAADLSGPITDPEDLRRAIAGAGHAAISGETVTTDSAMRQAAVYTSVRILAETVATCPVPLYRNTDDGRERVRTDHRHRLLNKRPNAWQTPYDFKSFMQSWLVLRGNAYAIKTFATGVDGRRTLRELLPFHPDLVEVKQRPDFSIEYRVRDARSGTMTPVPAANMLHLRDLSSDGIVGQSRISQQRNLIGEAIASDRQAGELVRTGAKLSGVLTTEQTMDPEQMDKVQESWQAQFSEGGSNRWGVAMLDGGWSFSEMTMNAHDAQFIENRKFSRSEIFGMFRIPPHLGGDLERSTFSNIEEQSLEFIKYSMLSWFVLWEQALDRDLLDESETDDLHFKFLPDALLRGDILTRYQSYAIGRMWGWLSANDVLALEERNGIGEDGDVYLSPGNMLPAEALADAMMRSTSGNPSSTGGPGGNDPSNGLRVIPGGQDS